MKTASIAILCAAALPALAITRWNYGHPVGNNRPGHSSDSLSHGSKEKQDKAKRLAPSEKRAQEKAVEKRIAATQARKVELPADPKRLLKNVNFDARISSLCGYELGTVYRGPVRDRVNDEGEIVVVEKLRKPFRTCTNVMLTYSSKTFGLYRIRIFSDPMTFKKMSPEAAKTELDAMAAAFSAKFPDKIKAWEKIPSVGHFAVFASPKKPKPVNNQPGAPVPPGAQVPPAPPKPPAAQNPFGLMPSTVGQTLKINSLDAVVSHTLLKNTAPSASEKGIAFSVELVDSAIDEYDSFVKPSAPPPKAMPRKADIDAL